MALVQNLDLYGTRLTEIAARAGMAKQSMLELVDKAERLSLVERRPDPDDQRAQDGYRSPLRGFACSRGCAGVSLRRNGTWPPLSASLFWLR